MKKRIASFLLALCLLLTACGQKQPEDPVVEDPVDVQQPQEQEEELLTQDDMTEKQEEVDPSADKEEAKEDEKKELEESSGDAEARARELSFLNFEVAEIEEAALTAGEDEILEEEYKKLTHGRKIAEDIE